MRSVLNNIKEVTLPDGTVKYMLKGQREPDTGETLERDGLIRFTRDDKGREVVTLLDPDHPRVVCYVVGVNLFCRKKGVPEWFPGYDATVVGDITDTMQ
jgi:hypothetical protein